MATKVVVCPECESPLVPGRYSCSGCGALLASVASVARPFARAEPAMPPLVEIAAPQEPAAEATDRLWEPAAAHVDVHPEPLGAKTPEPEAGGQEAAEPVAAPQSMAAATWVAPRPVATAAATPAAAPAWPEHPVWPPVAQAAPIAPPEVPRTPAGAYLPPSAVLPPGEALVNGSAKPTTEAASGTAGKRSLGVRFALGEEDGPLGLPAVAPGRTIAAGAGIAGLGFLLPWAEIVIGSGSMGSFFDQWGLAGPGHALVFLLLFGVGALAVSHEWLPVRVEAGLAAIVLGSVLLGLVFPYVMGPFREAVGVYVVAAGAVVMIVGGLLARAAQRHAGEDATV